MKQAFWNSLAKIRQGAGRISGFLTAGKEPAGTLHFRLYPCSIIVGLFIVLASHETYTFIRHTPSYVYEEELHDETGTISRE